MAETLEVLIQLAERKVEQKQRELATTHERLQWLAAEMVRLQREVEVAFKTAVGEDDVQALMAASAFQERMRRAVEELKLEEVLKRQLEAEQRIELQLLFAGQKKYELLLEKQKLARRKERLKKAQNQLDEVAGRKR
ncbi:MAG: hypothetical protein EON60_08860 [Alphaproteobacteria bacterium]|nr:MAG: hypothetical protein EON60_08860 [Alphaproteobacteria bacterium]